MQNSFEVAKIIGQDIGSVSSSGKGGFNNILSSLKHKKVTSYSDYQKIEEHELKTGAKVTTVEEMLRISGS